MTKNESKSKYLMATVEASTRTGAIRKARQSIRAKGHDDKWKLVGAVPKLKHQDKKLYLWDVTYRKGKK